MPGLCLGAWQEGQARSCHACAHVPFSAPFPANAGQRAGRREKGEHRPAGAAFPQALPGKLKAVQGGGVVRQGAVAFQGGQAAGGADVGRAWHTAERSTAERGKSAEWLKNITRRAKKIPAVVRGGVRFTFCPSGQCRNRPCPILQEADPPAFRPWWRVSCRRRW